MKNYYEILEINPNASNEIIEKAYRTLAKKYHPDGWPQYQSYWAEDKFKEITEAYQVLSNEVLRKEYDNRIGINTSHQDNYNNLYDENQKLKQEVSRLKIKRKSKEYTKKENIPQSYIKRYGSTIKSIINNEIHKPQEERSRDLKAFILTIIIIAILLIVFWNVPFLHNIIFP